MNTNSKGERREASPGRSIAKPGCRELSSQWWWWGRPGQKGQRGLGQGAVDSYFGAVQCQLKAQRQSVEKGGEVVCVGRVGSRVFLL